MRKLLAVLLFLVASSVHSETYLQVNGASIHEKPGYNGGNPGWGVEQTITENINFAAGVYQNSLYSTSLYGYFRYSYYKDDVWDLGINAGLATGYIMKPVMPMIAPEFCYLWTCMIVIPPAGKDTTGVLGFHLRIPMGE